MAADGTLPQLDALRALLTTALELCRDITADASVDRLLRAFTALPPEDRDVIARVIERAASWRRVAENTANLTGVRMYANPNARLYVNVVAPEDGATHDNDAGEILLGALRLVKQIPVLMRPCVRAWWKEPAVEALRMLTPVELEACAEFAREAIELVATAAGENTPAPRTTA